MSLLTKLFVALTDLGKGLKKNMTTNLIDVQVGTATTNVLKFDGSNALQVIPSTDTKSVLKVGSDGNLSAPISTDTQNGITKGSDGGMFVTAANQIPSTLGVFEGSFLKVVSGQATWVNILNGPVVAWPAQGLI